MKSQAATSAAILSRLEASAEALFLPAGLEPQGGLPLAPEACGPFAEALAEEPPRGEGLAPAGEGPLAERFALRQARQARGRLLQASAASRAFAEAF